MKRIKVRRAQIRDSKVVAKLWLQYELYEQALDSRVKTGSEDSYEKQFGEILGNKSSIVILAEYDTRIVGIVDYITYRKGNLKIGALGNLFVLEEYRGNGVGTTLTEYVMNKFRSQKCKFVASGVRVKNLDAQEFWKKRGFTIDPESIVNYSMRKKLV